MSNILETNNNIFTFSVISLRWHMCLIMRPYDNKLWISYCNNLPNYTYFLDVTKWFANHKLCGTCDVTRIITPQCASIPYYMHLHVWRNLRQSQVDRLWNHIKHAETNQLILRTYIPYCVFIDDTWYWHGDCSKWFLMTVSVRPYYDIRQAA